MRASCPIGYFPNWGDTSGTVEKCLNDGDLLPDYMLNNPASWLMGKSMHIAFNNLFPIICIDTEFVQILWRIAVKDISLGHTMIASSPLQEDR